MEHGIDCFFFNNLHIQLRSRVFDHFLILFGERNKFACAISSVINFNQYIKNCRNFSDDSHILDRSGNF